MTFTDHIDSVNWALLKRNMSCFYLFLFLNWDIGACEPKTEVFVFPVFLKMAKSSFNTFDICQEQVCVPGGFVTTFGSDVIVSKPPVNSNSLLITRWYPRSLTRSRHMAGTQQVYMPWWQYLLLRASFSPLWKGGSTLNQLYQNLFSNPGEAVKLAPGYCKQDYGDLLEKLGFDENRNA